MIRFSCPTCEALLNVADEKAGTKGPCPKCGQRILVPPPVRNAIKKTVLGKAPPDESFNVEIVSQPVADVPVQRPIEPPPEYEPAPARSSILTAAIIFGLLSFLMSVTLPIVNLLAGAATPAANIEAIQTGAVLQLIYYIVLFVVGTITIILSTKALFDHKHWAAALTLAAGALAFLLGTCFGSMAFIAAAALNQQRAPHFR